jgi:hypothetical protein
MASPRVASRKPKSQHGAATATTAPPIQPHSSHPADLHPYVFLGLAAQTSLPIAHAVCLRPSGWQTGR